MNRKESTQMSSIQIGACPLTMLKLALPCEHVNETKRLVFKTPIPLTQLIPQIHHARLIDPNVHSILPNDKNEPLKVVNVNGSTSHFVNNGPVLSNRCRHQYTNTNTSISSGRHIFELTWRDDSTVHEPVVLEVSAYWNHLYNTWVSWSLHEIQPIDLRTYSCNSIDEVVSTYQGMQI